MPSNTKDPPAERRHPACARRPDLEAADELQVFLGGDVVSVTVLTGRAGRRGRGLQVVKKKKSPGGVCASFIGVFSFVSLPNLPDVFFFLSNILNKVGKVYHYYSVFNCNLTVILA